MTTFADVIMEQLLVSSWVYMTNQHLFEILRSRCFSLLLELHFYMCVVFLFFFTIYYCKMVVVFNGPYVIV